MRLQSSCWLRLQLPNSWVGLVDALPSPLTWQWQEAFSPRWLLHRVVYNMIFPSQEVWQWEGKKDQYETMSLIVKAWQWHSVTCTIFFWSHTPALVHCDRRPHSVVTARIPGTIFKGWRLQVPFCSPSVLGWLFLLLRKWKLAVDFYYEHKFHRVLGVRSGQR